MGMTKNRFVAANGVKKLAEFIRDRNAIARGKGTVKDVHQQIGHKYGLNSSKETSELCNYIGQFFKKGVMERNPTLEGELDSADPEVQRAAKEKLGKLLGVHWQPGPRGRASGDDSQEWELLAQMQLNANE